MRARCRGGCTLATKKSEGKGEGHSRNGKLSAREKTIVKQSGTCSGSKDSPWKLGSMGKRPHSFCHLLVGLRFALTLTRTRTWTTWRFGISVRVATSSTLLYIIS